MNPQLLPVYDEDMNYIEELAVQIWPNAYGDILSSEQISYMLEKMYSLDSLLRQKIEGAHFFFVTLNNEKIGFLSFTDRGEYYYINKFYLLPKMSGKNIGSLVYKEMLKRIKANKPIRLNVNRYNIKAINFYFKLGFKIASFEDIKIGAGFEMNDFVMHSNP